MKSLLLPLLFAVFLVNNPMAMEDPNYLFTLNGIPLEIKMLIIQKMLPQAEEVRKLGQEVDKGTETKEEAFQAFRGITFKDVQSLIRLSGTCKDFKSITGDIRKGLQIPYKMIEEMGCFDLECIFKLPNNKPSDPGFFSNSIHFFREYFWGSKSGVSHKVTCDPQQPADYFKLVCHLEKNWLFLYSIAEFIEELEKNTKSTEANPIGYKNFNSLKIKQKDANKQFETAMEDSSLWKEERDGLIDCELKECGIKVLPTQFFKPEYASKLKKLDAYGSYLVFIPNAFKYWVSIQELNISNNALIKLPEGLEGLKSLKYLTIQDNPLQMIPNTFSTLTNLTSLMITKKDLTLETKKMLREMQQNNPKLQITVTDPDPLPGLN